MAPTELLGLGSNSKRRKLKTNNNTDSGVLRDSQHDNILQSADTFEKSHNKPTRQFLAYDPKPNTKPKDVPHKKDYALDQLVREKTLYTQIGLKICVGLLNYRVVPMDLDGFYDEELAVQHYMNQTRASQEDILQEVSEEDDIIQEDRTETGVVGEKDKDETQLNQKIVRQQKDRNKDKSSELTRKEPLEELRAETANISGSSMEQENLFYNVNNNDNLINSRISKSNILSVPNKQNHGIANQRILRSFTLIDKSVDSGNDAELDTSDDGSSEFEILDTDTDRHTRGDNDDVSFHLLPRTPKNNNNYYSYDDDDEEEEEDYFELLALRKVLMTAQDLKYIIAKGRSEIRRDIRALAKRRQEQEYDERNSIQRRTTTTTGTVMTSTPIQTPSPTPTTTDNQIENQNEKENPIPTPHSPLRFVQSSSSAEESPSSAEEESDDPDYRNDSVEKRAREGRGLRSSTTNTPDPRPESSKEPEIIVIDSSSDDGEEDTLAQAQPQLHEEPSNGNFEDSDESDSDIIESSDVRKRLKALIEDYDEIEDSPEPMIMIPETTSRSTTHGSKSTTKKPPRLIMTSRKKDRHATRTHSEDKKKNKKKNESRNQIRTQNGNQNQNKKELGNRSRNSIANTPRSTRTSWAQSSRLETPIKDSIAQKKTSTLEAKLKRLKSSLQIPDNRDYSNLIDLVINEGERRRRVEARHSN